MQDIKTNPITAAQLEEMKKMAGSYEALFSRRAMKYKEWGLKNKQLTEKDYRNYILKEYTFLKRPVVIVNDKIFVGSEKKNVEALEKGGSITYCTANFRSLVQYIPRYDYTHKHKQGCQKEKSTGKMNRCVFGSEIFEQIIHNRRPDDGCKAH